jgi:hypothetical protein
MARRNGQIVVADEQFDAALRPISRPAASL